MRQLRPQQSEKALRRWRERPVAQGEHAEAARDARLDQRSRDQGFVIGGGHRRGRYDRDAEAVPDEIVGGGELADGDAVGDRHADCGFSAANYYRKESFSKVAAPELLREIAANNDVVLYA